MSAPAAAAHADAAPAKGGKKKLLIIIIAAVVLLAGAGVGAMIFMKKKAAAEGEEGGEGAPAKTEHAAPKKEHKEEHKTPPVFVPMDPFVVNLADKEAERYAQIGVTLEVVDAHAGDDIKNYLPAIRNNVLMLLAHKSSADLAGREGKETLAKEIRREACRAMGYEVEDEDEDEAPSKKKKKKKAAPADDLPIKSVNFSSFIIQ